MKTSGTNDTACQSSIATSNTSKREPQLSLISTAVKLSILSLGLAHGASHAASIEVTSNLDDNSTSGCTLRQAIVSMNNRVLRAGCVNTGGTFGNDDSITFSNSLAGASTIVLNGAQLTIAQGRNISIDGSTVTNGITVDANRDSRVFYINNATLSINQMTITGGLLTGFIDDISNHGAGILATNNAFVSLKNSTVLANSTRRNGGGIHVNASTVLLSDSDISENDAKYGGGVYASSDAFVSVVRSSVSRNIAEATSVSGGGGGYVRGGGGIMANKTAVFITDSDVSGNQAGFGGSGGGVAAVNGSTASLVNTTLSDNRALSDGGGVFALQSSVSLSNSHVSGSLCSVLWWRYFCSKLRSVID